MNSSCNGWICSLAKINNTTIEFLYKSYNRACCVINILLLANQSWSRVIFTISTKNVCGGVVKLELTVFLWLFDLIICHGTKTPHSQSHLHLVESCTTLLCCAPMNRSRSAAAAMVPAVISYLLLWCLIFKTGSGWYKTNRI